MKSPPSRTEPRVRASAMSDSRVSKKVEEEEASGRIYTEAMKIG